MGVGGEFAADAEAVIHLMPRSGGLRLQRHALTDGPAAPNVPRHLATLVATASTAWRDSRMLSPTLLKRRAWPANAHDPGAERRADHPRRGGDRHPAFARFRINPVIGFILVGIIAGPFGARRADRAISLAPVGFDHRSRRDRAVRRARHRPAAVLDRARAELPPPGGDAQDGVRDRRGRAAGIAVLIGGALIAFDWPRRSARCGWRWRWRCRRPRWCCRSPGRRARSGAPRFAMLLFEDLALVPMLFLIGAAGGAAASGLGRGRGRGHAGDRSPCWSSGASSCRACSPRRRGPRSPNCSSRSACWW